MLNLYIICHVVHNTHEVAWVCAAAGILVLQHTQKLTPPNGALLGKIISSTQRTVVLPDMYVYPVDAVYVAIAVYTIANTLRIRSRIFAKQLNHRRIMLCVFILLSYVAHGRHSNILRQPAWQSTLRVALYLAAAKESICTQWDTLGKCLWILNVPFVCIALVPLQIKLEKDHHVRQSTEVVIDDLTKGPMLV